MLIMVFQIKNNISSSYKGDNNSTDGEINENNNNNISNSNSH